MGMNNIFYRTRGFLDGAYDDQRANLRMQIIGKTAVSTSSTLRCWRSQFLP